MKYQVKNEILKKYLYDNEAKAADVYTDRILISVEDCDIVIERAINKLTEENADLKKDIKTLHNHLTEIQQKDEKTINELKKEVTKPLTEENENLREKTLNVLGDVKAGLQWYREEYPQYDNKADDEMIERIEALQDELTKKQ